MKQEVNKMLLFVFILFIFAPCLGLSFYDILGVSRNADQRTIKRAYYQLSLTLHPDKIRNPSEEDKNKFMDIVKAYETLSDPEKRQAYDISGDGSDSDPILEKEYTDQPFSFKSFSKYYRFEATFTPRIPVSAPEIRLSVELPLKSFYSGISQHYVHFNRTSLCSFCDATGSKDPQFDKPCPYCNGTGLREFISLSPTKKEGTAIKSRCNICDGRGHVHDDQHACPYCRGTGIRIVEDYVDVSFDPGMRVGSEQTFRRQGNEQFGYRRGDVVVRLVAKADSLFSAEGYNLLTTVWVTLVESVVGIHHSLMLPSNEMVVIECKEKCSNQTRFTFPGKGIPIGNSAERGSLEVSLHVYIPVLFTFTQWNALQQNAVDGFTTMAMYIEYLVEEEEMYYSAECGVDELVCSFSLFNMIEYYLKL